MGHDSATTASSEDKAEALSWEKTSGQTQVFEWHPVCLEERHSLGDATSGDGVHYYGTYVYTVSEDEESYQPGEVQFTRIRERSNSEILQGFWIERGAWTIELGT